MYLNPKLHDLRDIPNVDTATVIEGSSAELANEIQHSDIAVTSASLTSCSNDRFDSVSESSITQEHMSNNVSDRLNEPSSPNSGHANRKDKRHSSLPRVLVQHSYRDHADDEPGSLTDVFSDGYCIKSRTVDIKDERVVHCGRKHVRRVPSQGAAAIPFPIKLFEMLERIEFDNDLRALVSNDCSATNFDESGIISWQPHGRCFLIRSMDLFKRFAMPKYFNLNKITSFQRQLNLYGFVRLSTGKDKGGYYHERFLRGRKDLVQAIQRCKVKGTGIRGRSNPDQEPDFWSMKWVGRFRDDRNNTSNSNGTSPSGCMKRKSCALVDNAKISGNRGRISCAGNKRKIELDTALSRKLLTNSDKFIQGDTSEKPEESIFEQYHPGITERALPSPPLLLPMRLTAPLSAFPSCRPHSFPMNATSSLLDASFSKSTANQRYHALVGSSSLSSRQCKPVVTDHDVVKVVRLPFSIPMNSECHNDFENYAAIHFPSIIQYSDHDDDCSEILDDSDVDKLVHEVCDDDMGDDHDPFEALVKHVVT